MISSGLSKENLAKRMYRAKKDYKEDSTNVDKRSKYIELCLVKAHYALEK